MANFKEIEERAAQWIARRDGGNWARADQAALMRWLEVSTAHMVAFLRLEAAWQQANRLKVFGVGFASSVVPQPGDLRTSHYFEFGHGAARPVTAPSGVAPRRTRTGRLARWSMAAALVAAALGGVWESGLLGQADYSTPVGGFATVPLPDGSKVLLNSGSDIDFAVSETERRVDLKQGEAFFEVAKDSRRPFVVVAADQRVVAVGTKFSVRHQSGGDIEVTVTEGQVRVMSMRAGQPQPVVQLTAGSVARASGTDVLVRQKSLLEVEELLSWRNGYVIFHETPLGEVVAEFNRYNVRQIAIEDPDIAAIRVGGKFRATNVEAFLRLLNDGFALRVEPRDGRFVLTAD